MMMNYVYSTAKYAVIADYVKRMHLKIISYSAKSKIFNSSKILSGLTAVNSL